ncbi:dynein regulatory complex subunit 2 isoform X2 [Eupeodes corollae]|nr:dynein regulatory complex subunit 2 isoform X2 [Eupeodes corollae]
MGKKGKSKNKLAKMSEEERARYLQLRADIEEEARRRKQHLISLYMKNKLKREDAFSRLNLAKINQEWRSILRQIKCQDLKNEMIEVEKFFRIALERKDRIIHQLLNELDIAEDMNATLQQSQMEIIRKMISTQTHRMQFFKDHYTKHKTIILQKCQSDFQAFKRNRNKAREELECVAYGLEDKAEASLKEKHEDHLQRLDEMRSSMTLQLEEITKEREQKLEYLWNKYQEVLTNYVKYTESFYVEYMELKETDEQSNSIIREQCYEIERATEQIANLKIAAANASDEAESQVEYLQKLRTDLTERLAQMKTEFNEQQKLDEKEFKTMVVASHNILKDLEKHVKKGESILQLAAVCRRLETEREKVLPFGLPKRNLFEDTEVDDTPPKELQGGTLLVWNNMGLFWRRVNNATLDVSNLIREKTHLEAENAMLKSQLRDYLIDLNIQTGSNAHVNEYVAKRPNSMMVERSANFEIRKTKSAENKASRRPYTCVEANFSNAVRSKMLVAGKPATAKIRTIIRQRT